MDTIICQGCKNLFNHNNKPILIACGHNLCEECLAKITYAERSFFCPFDRKFLKLDQCKINLRLLKIAQSLENKTPDELKAIRKPSRKKPIEKTPEKDVNATFLQIPKDNSYETEEIIPSTSVTPVNTNKNKKDFIKPQDKNLEILNDAEIRHHKKPYKPTRSTPNLIPNTAPAKPKAHKKRHKRLKGSKPGLAVADGFSLTKIAIVTVSVLGGIYLYNKLSLIKPNINETPSIAVQGALKQTTDILKSGIQYLAS
jgi:RING-type zinc-finger